MVAHPLSLGFPGRLAGKTPRSAKSLVFQGLRSTCRSNSSASDWLMKSSTTCTPGAECCMLMHVAYVKIDKSTPNRECVNAHVI